MPKATIPLLTLAAAALLGASVQAQSRQETISWIKQFIALNDGDAYETVFDNDTSGSLTLSYAVQRGQAYEKFWPLQRIKKVEVWHHDGVTNSEFVHIVGTAYDCHGIDEYHGLLEIMGKCPPEVGYFDIGLKGGGNQNAQNVERLKKAIVHLVEENGGTVNTPDIF